jgi:hypothetical protein
MYACVRESGCGFFEGSVRLGRLVSISQDPPHPAIRGWFYLSPACRVVLGAANNYSRLQYLVPSKKPQGGEQAIIRAHRAGAMQDAGYGLRRIHLPRTPVHNERLGSNIQTLTTPELMFRALLTKDGALRLELARM